MKSLLLAFAAPLAIAAFVSGCAYNSPQEQEANACRVIGPKALVGGVAGAAGGAAIGAAAGGGRGAAIGAGLGLLTGAVVGHIADQQDCAAAQAALQAQLFAAQANGRIAWSSQSGHSGQYVAIGDDYTNGAGATCRHAQSLPAAGGQPQSLLVCRQPGGDYSYTNA
jgi:surface antigen